MGKKTPAAPDYTAAAEKQGESSKEVTNMQTWANRPDQITPFGSQTWSSQPVYDPVTGTTQTKWIQNTTLTPDTQHALESQMDLQAGRSDLANSLFPRAQQEFGSAMDWGKFSPGAATPQGGNIQTSLDRSNLPGIDPSSKYYDTAGDAIYSRWANRQEPLMERQANQLETRLRNQGLKPGDEAYNTALSDLRNQQADARTMADYQATIGAGQEASRMFGMDSAARGQMFGENTAAMQFGNQAAGQQYNQNLSQANYQNTLRQQQIAEEMQRRGFSLNEINAIISGQQVGMPSMPSFNSATKANEVGYSGAAKDQYSAALDASNAQNAGMGNLLGTAAQVGGMAMMFSDRRIKKNIVKVGTLSKDPNIGLYSYRYVWQHDDDPMKFVGVMADEVKHIPNVVHQDKSGYDKVDYAALLEYIDG